MTHTRQWRPWVLAALALTAACSAPEGRDGEPEAAHLPEHRDPQSAEEHAAALAELARVERAFPGRPLPVTIGFGALVPDSALLDLVHRYGVAPYQLYLFIPETGAAGAPSVPQEAAHDSVVALARRFATESLEQSSCMLVGMADHAPTPRPGEPGRPGLMAARLKHHLQAQQALPRLRARGALAYGVSVVGPPERLRALAADARVRAFLPPVQARGHLGAPYPHNPLQQPHGGSPPLTAVDTLSDEAAMAQIRAIAAEHRAACDRPVPPRRPRGG